MRSAKRGVLRLVEVFVDKCEDDALLAGKFVPALMEPVLGDYAAAVPDARCGPKCSLPGPLPTYSPVYTPAAACIP
jgi:exportin-1